MATKNQSKRKDGNELVQPNSSVSGDVSKTKANALSNEPVTNPSRTVIWQVLKQRLWIFGLIALLSLGVLGAGLKYLEDSAKQQKANNANGLNKQTDQGLLSKMNPFVEPPLPSPTPQLSKEYLYAGSRMLAVEDANANAAPPADLAIWRPSTGAWWVMSGQGSQQVTISWGASTDIAVPGDYDGDGKTDFAVYRGSDGAWYIRKSSTDDGNWYSVSFGQSGDKPVQADYDGDGKTDIAVYRPSTGAWYLQQSTLGFLGISFGLSTDIPTPADFDGDGKADIAVRRGSDQTFYVLRSSNNQYQSQQLGQSSDAPVSADYDGDGKADYALRSGANWIIKQSSNNSIQTIAWQQSSDQAVQNDYDGDGKVDIAVWRESNGNWYIRKSSNGQLRQEQWGMTGDIPVPAFYRR